MRTAHGLKPEIELEPRLDELDFDGHIAQLVSRIDDPDGQLARQLREARTSSRAYQKVIRRVFLHWQRLEIEPGIESWPAFAHRTEQVMRDIAARSESGQTTIAVSSGAVIAAIVHGALGLPSHAVYPLFEAMKNCSITQLLHTHERLSLSSFNDTTYLLAMGANADAGNLITYR